METQRQTVPFPTEAPKPWFRSTAILANLGQIAVALILLVGVVVGWLPADAGALAATQMSLGVAGILGRARAATPIAPMPIVTAATEWVLARLPGR